MNRKSAENAIWLCSSASRPDAASDATDQKPWEHLSVTSYVGGTSCGSEIAPVCDNGSDGRFLRKSRVRKRIVELIRLDSTRLDSTRLDIVDGNLLGVDNKSLRPCCRNLLEQKFLNVSLHHQHPCCCGTRRRHRCPLCLTNTHR